MEDNKKGTHPEQIARIAQTAIERGCIALISEEQRDLVAQLLTRRGHELHRVDTQHKGWGQFQLYWVRMGSPRSRQKSTKAQQ